MRHVVNREPRSYFVPINSTLGLWIYIRLKSTVLLGTSLGQTVDLLEEEFQVVWVNEGGNS